jgi:DNA-binding IscR family transcriptional regulator
VKLQKNTSLALYSVLEFAGDPQRHISAAEIAAKYGVPGSSSRCVEWAAAIGSRATRAA